MDLYHNSLPFKFSHSSHCKRNIPILLSTKDLYYWRKYYRELRNFQNLKSNTSIIKQGFQKALSIPQQDLRKPKKPSNQNILPFIATFNPNNPDIYSTIKSSVNYLKNNNVSGFDTVNLLQSKRQPLNLLTEAEYGEVSL